MSPVHFEASSLLSPPMQSAGGCVRLLMTERAHRTAPWSWLHHSLAPSWLPFKSHGANQGRGRAGNVQGIHPAACQAPSAPRWLPPPAPRRIRPFLMDCQVIIGSPCLAFNASWQKINELTAFQQVLWSKTRACQHRQNMKGNRQGSLPCLVCLCASMKGSQGTAGLQRGKIAIKPTCGLQLTALPQMNLH